MPARLEPTTHVGELRRRISAAVLTTLLVSLSGCSVTRPDEGANGEQIYQQLCANCHGEDLSGALGPALDAGSNSASQPDEFLRLAILRGRGSMPSFSGSLEQGQVETLIGYLREVQQR